MENAIQVSSIMSNIFEIEKNGNIDKYSYQEINDIIKVITNLYNAMPLYSMYQYSSFTVADSRIIIYRHTFYLVSNIIMKTPNLPEIFKYKLLHSNPMLISCLKKSSENLQLFALNRYIVSSKFNPSQANFNSELKYKAFITNISYPCSTIVDKLVEENLIKPMSDKYRSDIALTYDQVKRCIELGHYKSLDGRKIPEELQLEFVTKCSPTDLKYLGGITKNVAIEAIKNNPLSILYIKGYKIIDIDLELLALDTIISMLHQNIKVPTMVYVFKKINKNLYDPRIVSRFVTILNLYSFNDDIFGHIKYE